MARLKRPNPHIFHRPDTGLHTRGFDVSLIRLRAPFNRLHAGHFATRQRFLEYAKAVRSRDTARVLNELRRARREAEAHGADAAILADISEVRRELHDKELA